MRAEVFLKWVLTFDKIWMRIGQIFPIWNYIFFKHPMLYYDALSLKTWRGWTIIKLILNNCSWISLLENHCCESKVLQYFADLFTLFLKLLELCSYSTWHWLTESELSRNKTSYHSINTVINSRTWKNQTYVTLSIQS